MTERVAGEAPAAVTATRASDNHRQSAITATMRAARLRAVVATRSMRVHLLLFDSSVAMSLKSRSDPATSLMEVDCSRSTSMRSRSVLAAIASGPGTYGVICEP
jgi:hypothetical protein